MPDPDNRLGVTALVIDDDPAFLRSVGNYLQARDYRVLPAGGGAEGLEILRREAVDIVITDVMMPDMDGFQVLREAKAVSPGTEVIMITGYGDVERAVRAMREGAFDFFTKPFKAQDLGAALQRTVRFQALRREKDRYRERLDRLGSEARQQYGLSAIVGGSPAIREVRRLIEQVCQAGDTTVLVCGETGTGKDMVARAVHYESARAGGPFVAVDCSAVPAALVESAFYGYEKGAFTDAKGSRKGHFELADGGTLFLDEIGDMDVGMQAKLLRTLEERRVRRVGGGREIPVDVRVVSATNRDLSLEMDRGRFREDLYYRLNAFSIRMPPLRERREDILPLAQFFLDRYARELRKPVEGFTPQAEPLLETHAFPGNIRELRNLIERAVILCGDNRIGANDLRFDRREVSEGGMTKAGDLGAPPQGWDLRQTLRDCPPGGLNLAVFEEEILREALRRSNGNQVQAAKLLGISRDALRRRMLRHNLSNQGPTEQDLG